MIDTYSSAFRFYNNCWPQLVTADFIFTAHEDSELGLSVNITQQKPLQNETSKSIDSVLLFICLLIYLFIGMDPLAFKNLKNAPLFFQSLCFCCK